MRSTWKPAAKKGPVYARNHDVHFVDGLNGWIIGREGVRRTEDGGLTWVRVDEEGKLEGKTIQLLDLQRGWVAGKFGAVYHTEDGGITWKNVPAYGNLEGLSGDEFARVHIAGSLNVPRGILESAAEWDYAETEPALVRVVVGRRGRR